jgi:hypothetical protein
MSRPLTQYRSLPVTVWTYESFRKLPSPSPNPRYLYFYIRIGPYSTTDGSARQARVVRDVPEGDAPPRREQGLRPLGSRLRAEGTTTLDSSAGSEPDMGRPLGSRESPLRSPDKECICVLGIAASEAEVRASTRGRRAGYSLLRSANRRTRRRMHSCEGVLKAPEPRARGVKVWRGGRPQGSSSVGTRQTAATSE